MQLSWKDALLLKRSGFFIVLRKELLLSLCVCACVCVCVRVCIMRIISTLHSPRSFIFQAAPSQFIFKWKKVYFDGRIVGTGVSSVHLIRFFTFSGKQHWFSATTFYSATLIHQAFIVNGITMPFAINIHRTEHVQRCSNKTFRCII